MKKIILLFLISGLCLSCKKETCDDGEKNQDEVDVDCGGVCNACPIEYPPGGTYGQNVLLNDDTLYLSPIEYSMRAIVPSGSSILIELQLVSGSPWGYGSETGWSVSSYDEVLNKQTFEALNSTCDLRLDLGWVGTGTVHVQYFENGASVTKSAYLVVS